MQKPPKASADVESLRRVVRALRKSMDREARARRKQLRLAPPPERRK